MGNNKIKKRGNDHLKVLSVREIEILKLISQELTTIEIAEKLFISPLTVETHRKHILHKTNSKTVVGLIKYAMKCKLVS